MPFGVGVGSMKTLVYKKGYIVHETFEYQLPFNVGKQIDVGRIHITPTGYLTVEKGFIWDGPTRAIDTPDFMRASLVHDVLYILIDLGVLTPEFKKSADRVLIDICREDGMGQPRRWWVHKSVRKGGGRDFFDGIDNPDAFDDAVKVRTAP